MDASANGLKRKLHEIVVFREAPIHNYLSWLEEHQNQTLVTGPETVMPSVQRFTVRVEGRLVLQHWENLARSYRCAPLMRDDKSELLCRRLISVS
jgi:hypothetical protein